MVDYDFLCTSSRRRDLGADTELGLQIHRWWTAIYLLNCGCTVAVHLISSTVKDLAAFAWS